MRIHFYTHRATFKPAIKYAWGKAYHFPHPHPGPLQDPKTTENRKAENGALPVLSVSR